MPDASQVLTWNWYRWAQSSSCSFWQIFNRIVLEPARRVTGTEYWSSFIPRWYSSLANTCRPLTQSFQALGVPSRNWRDRGAFVVKTVVQYITAPL